MDYFWIVVNISDAETPQGRDHKELENLRDCHLQGVRGISNSKEILTSFFGVGRNAAIFLKGEKILPYNDLHPIPYDDPEALVENDLALLARLYNKENDKYARYGIMLNIIQMLTRFATGNLKHELSYNGNRIPDAYQNAPVSISNLRDLAQFINKNLEDRDRLPLGEMIEICRKTIKRIGETYSDEAEWIVNSPELVYPIGSIMLVRVNQKIMDMLPEWELDPDNFKWMPYEMTLRNHKRLLNNIQEYRLDKRYQIRYIDGQKWDSMREHLWSKRKTN